jgi:importin subunit alpha-2
LSDGSNDKIEDVVKAGVVPRLVQLLDAGSFNVVTPCLRAVGNIVTGNDSQTQAVLKSGVLPHLAKLLRSSKSNIVKEAAWTVSNIAAGTLEQINMIVHTDIIPLLINVLKNGDFRCQKEAIWAITNITSGGSVEHMVHLGNAGMIPAFCDLLNIRDWKTIVVLLDGIENMLKGAAEVGQAEKVAFAIEECGGLDKIEQLQSHENTTVYNKAYTIIENYFSVENEEDADLIPDRDMTGDFQLSVSTPQNGYEL